MLNSRQRAQLRGLANGISPVVMLGKDGMSEQITKQTDEVLEARELIKIKRLESCPCSAREAAEAMSFK